MKKLILVAFALLTSVMMTGCNDNKAKELVGNWIQKTSDEYPSEVYIGYSDDHYSISVKTFDSQKAESKKNKIMHEYLWAKEANPQLKKPALDFKDCWKVYAYVGKAISDTEIIGDGFTARFEKESNTLLYDGNIYMKK